MKRLVERLFRSIAGLMVAAVCCGRADTSSMCGPDLWAGLRPGPYAVGFQRDTVAGPSSDIEVFEWYPGLPGRQAEACMHFDEYVAAAMPGTGARARAQSLAERISPGGDVPPAVLDRILLSRTAARADAPAAPGRHALVLWSARHETVLAQSVLSEYLASHGFVVAAIERAGARLPAPYEIADPTRRLPVLIDQLADLGVALDTLLRSPRVDTATLAILAWSYGGESAAALQRRRRAVDLVIGLSSNIAGGGVYQVADTLPASTDARRVPYMLLTEDTAAQTDNADAPAVSTFPGLAHGNFNVVEGLLPGLFPDVSRHQPWSRGGPAAVDGYRAVAEAVLDRLRATRG